MSAPLGYFLTWTTYGTWLPGDQRGWVDKHDAGTGVPYHEPDPIREAAARARMSEEPVILDMSARRAVEAAVRETCSFRSWTVRGLSVRSNHVHVVVSAGDVPPGKVMKVLKSHATRALNLLYPSLGRKHWWTEDGSRQYLNDEDSLFAAIRYAESQDTSWMKNL